jgi:hypothetical protein
MAEKCSSCGNPIAVMFLEKISGTYLRDKKGKKKAVCNVCQKKFSVLELRQKI